MSPFIPIAMIYMSVMALVAFRLGWHMAFSLDRFDWQYARRDVWFIFILASLLWPLLLFRPSVFSSPGGLFQMNFSLAATGRLDARFWSNPPSCGKRIRYRPHKIFLSGGEGEFEFLSAEVEEAILEKLRESPHLAKHQLGSILKWLQLRDESIAESTSLPGRWWDFHAIADQLLRKGRGEVRCLTCNQAVPINVLQANDMIGQPGWNFNQLCCPGGHVLLRVETMHIYVRRDAS